MKLENLKIQLNMKYTIDEEAVDELKRHRLTENEIRDVMLESRSEDLAAALKEELARTQHKYDYTFTNVHVDIDYPITDVYFDVESTNTNDTKEIILTNVVNALMEYEHAVYARFSELDDSAQVNVVFDAIEE